MGHCRARSEVSAAVVLASVLLGCGVESAGTSWGSGGYPGTEGGDPGASTSSSRADESTGGAASSASESAALAESSDSGADAPTGGGVVLDVGSGGDGPVGCNDSGTQAMYLLDFDTSLYRFDPETLDLTQLGALACPGVDMAMALTIDRAGTLWAMMADGNGTRHIVRVDPETLGCEDTGFVDPVPEYVVFSLAFVADAIDAATETLYINGLVGGINPGAASALLRVADLDTMDAELMGEFPIATPGMDIADLTGTGEARLFALFANSPPVVAEADPQSADFVWEDELGFGTGSGWAFAQWAGRLWVFSGVAADFNSAVHTYDPIDGSEELVIEDLGIQVVGAAVSTCAPYEPEG